MPKASGEGLLVNAKVSTKEKGGVRCDKVTSDKRTLMERGKYYIGKKRRE